MDISVKFSPKEINDYDLWITPLYQLTDKKGEGKKVRGDYSHWDALLAEEWQEWDLHDRCSGASGKNIFFSRKNGKTVLVVGMGEKSKITREKLRTTFSQVYLQLKDSPYQKIVVDIESFHGVDQIEQVVHIFSEALILTSYQFNKFMSEKKEDKLHFIFLCTNSKLKTKIVDAQQEAKLICEGVNFARDLINEPPNILNSERLAQIVANDAKNLPKVKVQVLDKKQIVKEKMNLLLSVNQGSAFEPRVVHLSYTPSKTTNKTKHIALVGKGLTYDSGGYCIKPAGSMKTMKGDMAGAATVYAAFRNAVQIGSPYKISCFLGITDNMISPTANVPDVIINGRSGKSVEILNTDAEGRLVLADILDYACDFKPDFIIDVATLTGACIRALGSVCGVMGNSQALIDQLLKSAINQDEGLWQLPLLDEYRDDIKGTISDIKNLSNTPEAGAQKAAAFLEHFIKDGTAWAHLDIAGVNEGSRPYCPKGSASGLIVRTLTWALIHGKEFSV